MRDVQDVDVDVDVDDKSWCYGQRQRWQTHNHGGSEDGKRSLEEADGIGGGSPSLEEANNSGDERQAQRKQIRGLGCIVLAFGRRQMDKVGVDKVGGAL